MGHDEVVHPSAAAVVVVVVVVEGFLVLGLMSSCLVSSKLFDYELLGIFIVRVFV